MSTREALGCSSAGVEGFRFVWLVGPNKAVKVEAELFFSFLGCEVQRAAIKSDCCK
jgi:hypothetical protein